MEATNITAYNISRVFKRAQKWKAHEPDMVHISWYKYLTCVHPVLARCIHNIIDNPEFTPSFMLERITYMRLKIKKLKKLKKLDK